MGVRIVVGLTDGAAPGRVAERLRGVGAQEVLPYRTELPGVLVALFPDAVGGQEAVARVVRLSGVAYAEPDAVQGI